MHLILKPWAVFWNASGRDHCHLCKKGRKHLLPRTVCFRISYRIGLLLFDKDFLCLLCRVSHSADWPQNDPEVLFPSSSMRCWRWKSGLSLCVLNTHCSNLPKLKKFKNMKSSTRSQVAKLSVTEERRGSSWWGIRTVLSQRASASRCCYCWVIDITLWFPIALPACSCSPSLLLAASPTLQWVSSISAYLGRPCGILFWIIFSRICGWQP